MRERKDGGMGEGKKKNGSWWERKKRDKSWECRCEVSQIEEVLWFDREEEGKGMDRIKGKERKWRRLYRGSREDFDA